MPLHSVRRVRLILDYLLHQALLLGRQTAQAWTTCAHTGDLSICFADDIDSHGGLLVQTARTLLEDSRVLVSHILDGPCAQLIPEHILHMVVHGWQLASIVEVRQLRFDSALGQHHTPSEALCILGHWFVDQPAWTMVITGCLASLDSWVL